MKCLVLGKCVDDNLAEFRGACIKIGSYLSDNNHSLLICSPFDDSADYWVLRGYNESSKPTVVEIHFIDTDVLHREIENLQEAINTRLIKIPHVVVEKNEIESKSYSWLFCQLQALENCDFIITIGGNKDGSAKMLLLIAESRELPIIPFPCFGGGAEIFYHRNYYELADKLGNDFSKLSQKLRILDTNAIELLLSEAPTNKDLRTKSREEIKFFISYSRERPHEADFVENILRRRNLKVFRDDADFGAGSNIPNEIKEHIYSSDVFISMWCSNYACSPWCYDELQIALDRMNENQLQLWLFCIDETRIVPKRARDIVFYRVESRDALEGQIIKLLSKLDL